MKNIETTIGTFEVSRMALLFNDLNFYERLEAIKNFSLPVYKENDVNLTIKIRINKEIGVAYIEAKDYKNEGEYFFCNYPFKQKKSGDKYVRLYSKKDLKGFTPKVGNVDVITKSPHKYLRKGSIFKVEGINNKIVIFTTKQKFKEELAFGWFRPALKEEVEHYNFCMDNYPEEEINTKDVGKVKELAV